MPCNIPREHGGCQFNVPEEEIYAAAEGQLRCIFHLGTARELTEEERATFDEKLKEYFLEKLKLGNNERIDFRNVSFHKQLNPQFFKGIDFNQFISFQSANFQTSMDFSECKFNAGAGFGDMAFQHKVSFRSAVFNGDTWFRKVDF